MSIDDRGRRAARSLNTSVDAGIDLDEARQAVLRGGGRPGRSPRVLAAAAAVAVLVVVVGAALLQVTGDRDGLDTGPDRLDRIGQALPGSPIDGKESMRLPVVAVPQKGLVDGQTIVVIGRGYQPDESVGVVFCAAEADTGAAGVDACELGDGFSAVAGYGNASDEGIARVEVQVRRSITTAKTGRIDCASAPERCIVAMGAVSDYDRSGGSYLLFDGSPPFPEPSLRVAPTTGLAPGQQVLVAAKGLVAGRQVQVQQCAGDRCVMRTIARVSDEGAVTAGLTVYPSVRDDRGEVACGGRCTVRVTGIGTNGASAAPDVPAVPIEFDPDAPAVTTPPATEPPTSTTTVPVTTAPSVATTVPASSATGPQSSASGGECPQVTVTPPGGGGSVPPTTFTTTSCSVAPATTAPATAPAVTAPSNQGPTTSRP